MDLYKKMWTQFRPNKMSGLIWIQTVWHFDGIFKRILGKVDFEKKSADDEKPLFSNRRHAYRILIYLICALWVHVTYTGDLLIFTHAQKIKKSM